MVYSSVATGQLCVESDKIPGATDSAVFMVPTNYSSVAIGRLYVATDNIPDESYVTTDGSSVQNYCTALIYLFEFIPTDNQSDATQDLSVAIDGKSVVYLYLALTILDFQVDVISITEEHNMTVDNPSTASKDEKNGACFSILAGLPWHLVDEVYILINCGDEFHWVLAVIVLKERRIRVYDSMSRKRRSEPSSKIQKMVKILPTYIDMSGFLDQKVRTNWSTIEAYRDKMANLFDVQYVDGIAQQTIGILNCGSFVASYTEYLSDGLQVPNDGLDAGLLRKRYAALLWKYREAKAQKPYATKVQDPRRSKPNSIALDEEQLVHID
ncbi:hypothetical protein T459_27085 [Capsicum annuum]|uniref:Ubiquitin-like protease family profile domain-containing protein n=1 Tax=Capsicum annuum TaxID=4072 RepID=A0A2G2YCX2_CAPAN|nr:hypothetical protein T459_27085 [Capsicum annuum]